MKVFRNQFRNIARTDSTCRTFSSLLEVAPEKKDEGQGSAKNGASHQKNFNAEEICIKSMQNQVCKQLLSLESWKFEVKYVVLHCRNDVNSLRLFIKQNLNNNYIMV